MPHTPPSRAHTIAKDIVTKDGKMTITTMPQRDMIINVPVPACQDQYLWFAENSEDKID